MPTAMADDTTAKRGTIQLEKFIICLPVAFGLMYALYTLYVRSAVVATVSDDLKEKTLAKPLSYYT